MDLPVPHVLPDLLKEGAMGWARYLVVWLSLLALTALTVTMASLNLGRLSIVVVLAIAAAKSTLVLLFFMHLLRERLLFKLLVPIAVAALAIFIALTYVDILHR
jgi:cytochrome c oxidase subunit IV